MADQVFPPNLQSQVRIKNTFSTREVGLSHPDTPGFIRMTDSGDIHIMADDGLGLIFNYKNRSCTILADTIRFITTDNEGLAWNDLFFNASATTYSQPTFNAPTGSNVKNVFAGAENYYTQSDTPPTNATSQDVSAAPSSTLGPSTTGIVPVLPMPNPYVPKPSSPAQGS